MYCYSHSFSLQLLKCFDLFIYLFLPLTSCQFVAQNAVKQQRVVLTPFRPKTKVEALAVTKERCMWLQIAARGTLSWVSLSKPHFLYVKWAQQNITIAGCNLQTPLPPNNNTFLMDHLIFILEGKQRGSWKQPKDYETLDEDERKKPNTHSHHQLPLPADDFTGQSGGSGTLKNTYCILLAMFLCSGLHDR